MCPYARFQSVMVDPDTFVVTYDKRRGDPRGGRSRKVDHKAAGLGDCVDCSLCVQVCPTGIDIRDGLQYMCIGCGACIDACEQVMDKMQYEPGLIRYTSERAMLDGLSAKSARSHLLRPRVLIYGTLILALAIAFVASLAMRNPLRVDVIRDRGALGREVAGGMIENVYRLQIINTSDQPMRLQLSVEGMPGLKVMMGQQGSDTVDVEAAANKLVPMVIRAPAGAEPGAHAITLRARGQDGESRPVETDEPASFYVPD
jgi:cytochrome c oxidase accessory protein FixG